MYSQVSITIYISGGYSQLMLESNVYNLVLCTISVQFSIHVSDIYHILYEYSQVNSVSHSIQ